MAEPAPAPCVYVLAGTNGGGKSTVGGAMLWRKGAEYYDPDEAARRILAANPGLSQEMANSAAWNQGKRLLERAIETRSNFAFETTLGGRTIPSLLEKALKARIEVRIWYVGLESPELHIKRVRARVRRGGHDIPESKIRERYVHSLWNLVRLLPKLTEAFVYDNSAEADPASGATPEPILILHAKRGKLIDICELKRAPNWTKPILMVALSAARKKRKER